MITRPTVFVLGAGASQPYDFPVGAVLQERVIQRLSLSQGGGTLGNLGLHAPRDIEEFRKALSLAAMPSIDAFLERQPKFLEVGKAAIAETLMRYEDAEKICRSDAEFARESWLHYLWQHIDNTFEGFDSNRISFITFNYDRTLEYFLHVVLCSSSGKPAAECTAKLGKIPIIHLHGRLGYLPWQDKVGRGFDTNVTPALLKLCVDNIKVVHEDIIDRDFELAKQLLKAAERIYFLGFGFYEKNIERLGITNLDHNKSQGTAYGMTSHEIARIRAQTGQKVELRPQSCIQLLRNEAEWS